MSSLEDYPISNIQIQDLLISLNVKVVIYSDITSRTTLTQLFKQSNGRDFVLLYDRVDVGHFVSILRQKDTTGKEYIEYFDSLAQIPDYPSGDKKHKITKLLANYGKPVLINPHKLQSDTSDHCGRWCISRHLAVDTPLNEYVRIFTDDKLTPDEMVNRMINVHNI